MNTPTKLTVSRIVLTIVMIFILLFPFYDIGVEFPRFLIGGIYVKSEYLVAGVIFLIASLTDFIDGYLARKNHQVTDLGKMLDAIADKALVNSALIILAVQGFVPAIIPVVVIFRDTIVDAINDKNVLPFRVDYHKTMDAEPDIDDKSVWDIDREKAYMAPKRNE